MLSFIFDIDDTMYHRLTPFRLACEKQFGIAADEAGMEDLFHAFIRHGNEVFEDSMNGSITMEEMYIYRTTKTMEERGISLTPKEALDWQTAYQWQQDHILLDPALREMLDLCSKKGAFLGIITNGPSAHQRKKYRALGLTDWISEDHVITSGEVGINKPDPEIFHIAARRWGLSPQETWYVGDSYEHDIISAAQAGWHTIWLDRKYQSESGPSDAADYIAHSEKELLRILSGIL